MTSTIGRSGKRTDTHDAAREVEGGARGALAAVITLGAAGWPDARVRADRGRRPPRLYLRPGDLTALRTRVTQAPASTYYNQMKSRMDGTAARHTNDEVAGFELESLALLHLVNGGTTYRNKILNTWRRTSYAAGQITHWNLPYQVMAHSLALDYLWNDLSAAQRTEFGTVIVAMMDDLYNYSPHNQSGANPMSDYSNQLYYHLGALAFAGGVLSGEGINDGRAAFYMSEAAVLLGSSHMRPAMNQEAGGDADMNQDLGVHGQRRLGRGHGASRHDPPDAGPDARGVADGDGTGSVSRVSNGLAKLAQRTSATCGARTATSRRRGTAPTRCGRPTKATARSAA